MVQRVMLLCADCRQNWGREAVPCSGDASCRLKGTKTVGSMAWHGMAADDGSWRRGQAPHK